ncbi:MULTISPECIES: hypothetical protein [Bacillaceae]|uniref:Uncharacterized protein n=1 Tax=Evansella alkalicola TaxID=745819 RepID=A0ABS6JV96_9BACI|nr:MULTISPECIES: hypothetical protein [Bacillaceae]MBU9721619.1 hypothetical protein [Bacillus alkalicola]
MKLIKNYIIFLIIFCMIFSLFGSSVSANGKPTLNDNVKIASLSEELVKVVDEHITIIDNAFVLTDIDTLRSNITSDEYELIVKVISETNESIKLTNNSMETEDNTFTAEITDRQAQLQMIKAGYNVNLQTSSGLEFGTLSTNEGVTKVVWRWWGPEIYLSRTVVQNIILHGTGVGLAAISGLVSGGVLTAVGFYIRGVLIGHFISESNIRPIVIYVRPLITTWDYQ